ncbi:hypothetical protein EDC04DRAFT_2613924 [Pisolithus marmoratus]|nr:hypothetical protein EDC04DRAFT_2613924 [Pisolithus marmoratus]
MMDNDPFEPFLLIIAALRGPMKTREHCKRQISSLKTVLRDINQWCSTLGVHWDNVNGAKVGTEEEKQVFKSWLQGRPTNSMCHFENCGWPHLEAPWVGTPSGTVADGIHNDGFVEKPPDFINTQPQAFSSPHSLMPPPASPAVFASSALPSITGPMQSSRKHSLAALETISLEDDGERSLKKAKKAAAQQIQTDKLQLALTTVEEWDKDLSIEAKAALMEVFHVDVGISTEVGFNAVFTT